MRLWRIAREQHVALDGEGARLNGGRWNSEGFPVVYMSSTLSLAALEYLVHVDKEDAPSDLMALEVEIPDDASQELVTLESLPDDWNRVPDHAACIARGDQWIARAEALLLRVPSAVIPNETNVLMNPQHPHAARVRIASSRKFAFDPRLQG